MLTPFLDLLRTSGIDCTTTPVSIAGPYNVVEVPGHSAWVVMYDETQEPIDPDEQADAWELVECRFPGFTHASLVGMITHKHLVVELFAILD